MLLANALTALVVLLFVLLAFAVLRGIADHLIKRANCRDRLNEPDTHGDEGGMPWINRIEGRAE